MHRQQKQYASFKSLAPKDATSKYTCLEIQDLASRQKIVNDNKIVCIYLWASWCNPCKIIAPEFADLAERYNQFDGCILVKENIDLNLTRDFQVTVIPAFIFYVKGELLRNDDNSPVSVIGGDIKQVEKILNNLIAGFK